MSNDDKNKKMCYINFIAVIFKDVAVLFCFCLLSFMGELRSVCFKDWKMLHS